MTINKNNNKSKLCKIMDKFGISSKFAAKTLGLTLGTIRVKRSNYQISKQKCDLEIKCLLGAYLLYLNEQQKKIYDLLEKFKNNKINE